MIIKYFLFLFPAPSFSAICMFFGEQLYDELEVPIGLIQTAWGGTIVEAWSPPEVIQECGVADEGSNDSNNHNNYLWNAMIHPLLRMSIKGAIWYQGEANTGHNRELYDCTFPSMIRNWRQAWHQGRDISRLCSHWSSSYITRSPTRALCH